MRTLAGPTLAIAALTVLTGGNIGMATPPTGQFSSAEYGRAQQVADAELTVPSGRDVASASYTLAPGGDTGWRTGPGNTVVAVTGGALAVHQAEGCASNEVTAGNTVVLPPGPFRLQNSGTDPVELLTMVTGLPEGSPEPFLDGPSDPAPACDGFAAPVPSGLSATYSARGVIPPDGGGSGGGHDAHQAAEASYAPTAFRIQGGKDAFMATYRIEPGFSTGWFVHTEHVVIITKGVWTFYEGHDGECEKVEEYHAGEAWAHGPHPHMGVNEGDEPAELTLFGFNLKHGSPMPVLDSNPDHFDFSTPPQCGRLR